MGVDLRKILVGEWDSEKRKRREWKVDNESYIPEQLLLWATGVSSFRNGNFRNEKLGIYSVTPTGYCLRAVFGSAHFPVLRKRTQVQGLENSRYAQELKGHTLPIKHICYTFKK